MSKDDFAAVFYQGLEIVIGLRISIRKKWDRNPKY